jgi:hypothetical protein
MSNITKIFYQSWDSNIPSQVLDETIKYIPKDFIYKRFSIKDIQDYLKNYWGEDLLKLFNSYKKIPHKIDLWRYCILYDTGGVYMDADCILKSDISILLNNDAVFVTNDRQVQNIFNGFIMTIPKNPILKEIIDYMINVNTSFENDYYYNCQKLYNIINKYIDINHINHNYIFNLNGLNRICILIDKEISGRYYVYYNNMTILVETNELYPYKERLININKKLLINKKLIK